MGAKRSSSPSLLHSLLQRVFIEHLWCARHCATLSGNEDNDLVLLRFSIYNSIPLSYTVKNWLIDLWNKARKPLNLKGLQTNVLVFPVGALRSQSDLPKVTLPSVTELGLEPRLSRASNQCPTCCLSLKRGGRKTEEKQTSSNLGPMSLSPSSKEGKVTAKQKTGGELLPQFPRKAAPGSFAPAQTPFLHFPSVCSTPPPPPRTPTPEPGGRP